ncbi:MAG: redoxin domain-containing protein [Dehalococcoidia bacterium]
MTVEAGDRAPAFTVETTDGPRTLDGLIADGPLVLAFYAEDATPACTTEVCGFRDEYETLAELGATVLAVSADSLQSHRAFLERLGGLPYPLASDPELVLAEAYGVVDADEGRSYRAVFVVGTDGVVLAANPRYQPQTVEQFAAIFEALGFGAPRPDP